MHASSSTSRLLLTTTTLALTLCAAGSALAERTDKLFFIQRSKSADEVHYDARVTKDGALDPKNPVDGYWILKAEGGGRDSLSLLQKLAYGYDVNRAPDGRYTLRLTAFKERPMALVEVSGRWRAQTSIAGKQGYMSRLYVKTDESGVFPKVLYVDIFGEEVGTGKAIQEHLVNN